jgi:hypothetical protein
MNTRIYSSVLLAVFTLALQTTHASSVIYFSTTVNHPAQLENTYASTPISLDSVSSFMAPDSGALVPAVSFGNSNPNNVINLTGPTQNITPVTPEPSVTILAVMGFIGLIILRGCKKGQRQVVG